MGPFRLQMTNLSIGSLTPLPALTHFLLWPATATNKPMHDEDEEEEKEEEEETSRIVVAIR